MQPFVSLTGIVAPLDALHVDTDQIIPKQFLMRIGRTGLAAHRRASYSSFENDKPHITG